MLPWLPPKWDCKGQLRCFHMCCVSKHRVDLGMLSRLILIVFFSLSVSLRAFLRGLTLVQSWLSRVTRGLLDLPEGSDFWGMFNRSCQTENSPQCSWPPILAQSAHGSSGMLCVALTAQRSGLAAGPFWTNVRLYRWRDSDVLAVITLRNSLDKGICSCSAAVLPHCGFGSVGWSFSYRWGWTQLVGSYSYNAQTELRGSNLGQSPQGHWFTILITKQKNIIHISQGNQNISSVFPPVLALSCEILTTFTFSSSYALLKCRLY